MTKSFGDQTDKATFYCTTCPRLCRFSCPIAEAENRETVTPWGLMRLLEMARQDVVPVDEDVAEAFYHCSGCRRCETWCLHHNDVPQAMWAARAWTYEKGLAPQAVKDIVERFEHFGAPARLTPLPDDEGLSVEDCFDERSAVAFFPDCKTRQHQPELVLRVGLLLERLLGHKVRLVTRLKAKGPGCCGFELGAAGATGAQLEHEAQLWRALDGVKEVITDCAPFVASSREGKSFGQAPAPGRPKITHIIELLDRTIHASPPNARLVTERVMLHDSCYVGRHLELYEQTRRVAAVLFEQPPGELSQARDQAQCCGAQGLYDRVNPSGAHQAAQTIIEQLEREGGEAIVCGQAGCKRAFGAVREDVAIDLLEAACMAYEV